jgi:hypothetical protein
MTTLGALASHVRSKNAGPFWLTIDVFFADDIAYNRASHSLTDPAAIGARYAVRADQVRIHLLPQLLAIKVSMPRSVVQGCVGDRDMHAGQQFVALLGLPLPDGDPE